MEAWRRVWREGFASLMPTKGLEAFKIALETDDPRLLQGATTTPPPLMCVQDWPCEAACPVAFCGWKGEVLETDTVGDVEEFFAKKCFDVDQILGEPAGCRWFLNWFDETPRQQMRKEMIPEVQFELDRRANEQVQQ